MIPNKRVLSLTFIFLLTIYISGFDLAYAATTTVNFDNPAPAGSSGGYINGNFQGINYGSGQWRWEGPYGPNNTKHIYFNSSKGKSRTFTFVPGPKILTNMKVFTGKAGTLTLTDDKGQKKIQNISQGSLQLVQTGWVLGSSKITINFSLGWELGVDDITFMDPVSSDTTVPVVSISAPANNATISGSTVTVSATASDNVGVVGVQFKLDGNNLSSEDTTSPYGMTLDSKTIANGAHTLTATARDAAGNSTTSSVINVTVLNDTTTPTVSISAPANNATISGNAVTVSANATDNVGVVGVQFKLDGNNLGSEDGTSPYSVILNSTTLTNDAHTLRAVARDAAGNTTTSVTINITVNNLIPDTAAPTVPQSLSATAVSASSSQINLTWSASTDNVGVTQYRVERCTGASCTNFAQVGTSSTNTYNDTGLTVSTAYRYRVRAADAAGNLSGYSSTANATTQTPPPSGSGAPARARPYLDPACSNPDVFFCEDFEGQDIYSSGNSGGQNTWGNPAFESTDVYWNIGGSHQRSTINLPGFDPAVNHVWRVSKSQGFTDIVTGVNTGTGSGTMSGWLKPAIMGTGAREWYTRIQVYFHTDHTWPSDYDFKMFFALPRTFIDPPSAAYETGMTFHQDFWCSGQGNFNDVPAIRYSSNFRHFPYQNEYCPPLQPGLDANGTNAPRVQKGRWYTLEYHAKLASDNTGILEMWVDGKKAYQYNGITCHNGCADMGYIMIMGWMNGADQQTGYYEIDNVVMSRKYIGPPAAAPAPN